MNKEFLYTLLDNMSVSGHEIPLQKKIIAEMTPYCDEIRTDYTGNVISILNPDAPFKVLLAAHIDEIGMIVTHIQEDGLLRVGRSGGIRAHTYPGRQVVIYGHGGDLEIGFNNKYLMDALKNAPADRLRLEFTSGVAPCVILPAEGEENFIYMVLPVRLKAN